MALPAFTVHSVVKYSAKAFVNQKNVRVRAWGPTLTGLAVVPRASPLGVAVSPFDAVTDLLSHLFSAPVHVRPPG